MKIILFVALSGLGALLRWGATSLEARYFDFRFIPLGVLFVNTLGSYAMGWIYSAQQSGRVQWSDFFTLCMMVAFLGSLTTFSSFALDTVKMLQSGELFLATVNVLATNGLCLAFCYVGMKSSLALT